VRARSLEAVHLDSLLVDLKSSRQEIHHLLALVTLKLENITVLLVVVDMAVAAKVLLKRLKDTLQVVLARYTLDGRDSLTTITLLASNVDIVDGLSIVVTSVGEGI
jgi:hypothetical protein